MAAELRIAPEAELDIAEAYAWYEDNKIGLGEEFMTCIDACIQAVLRNPEMYGVIHENYRRSLVRRFPFAIFYEYEAGVVTIYSVFHISRDPAKWRRRLP